MPFKALVVELVSLFFETKIGLTLELIGSMKHSILEPHKSTRSPTFLHDFSAQKDLEFGTP
jgi:hypothetical protein